MSYIGRAWRGEAELWTIFWLGWVWPVIFSVAIVLVSFLVIFGFHYLPQYAPDKDILTNIRHGALLLVSLWYAIWQPIAIWRCAWNADHVIWTYIARVIAGINIACAVLTFVGCAFLLYISGSVHNFFAILQSHQPHI